MKAITHALAGLALGLAAHAASAQPLTLEQIMADPDWIGPAVENAHFSLDGQDALFRLKREGSPLRDVYRIDLSVGGAAAQQVEDSALASLDAPDPQYDDDRSHALFVRDGDIFLRELSSNRLMQLTRSEALESEPRFMADGRIMYRSGNDWFIHDTSRGLTAIAIRLMAEKDPAADPEQDLLRDMQLRLIDTLARERDHREAQQQRDRELRRLDPTRLPAPVYLGDKVEIVDTRLGPDGRWLLLVTEPKGAERGRGGKMPKYVTESGYEEVEDVRTRVGRQPPQGQSLHLVDIAAGEVHALKLDPLPGIGEDPLAELRKAAEKPALEGQRAVRVDGLRFSDDGSRAAVMLRANDNKDRWIASVDFDDKVLVAEHRLTDPAWINWAFNDFGFVPGSDSLWFLSEESGHSHLYTRTARGRTRQHTRGEWEVHDPHFTADGRQLYFVANRAWPGDFELYRLNLESDEVVELTALDGIEGFVLSPDESQVLLTWSSSYMPQQLALMPAAGGEVRRLTDTRSDAFRRQQWLQPEFVQVPSSHGAGDIWGKFYAPKEMEPGKRYPIALFVHGAGYLQNVHERYPNYFREQMFHNLLVQHGYLVLDLDFRASAGYGRDWRTAIYRQMGHPELEDYLDGIDWLVENHQGDRDRVGIYGGSYGGFMAFMALFRAPEAFHAGAALRPVTDWTQYNHPYTSNILNTPEIDPEAYRKSSPIEYADQLQGHLLISHGMIDDNVFYQDSVRLAQRLIELRKHNWELASYPLERHAYQHPESWYDQYRRIFELFERAIGDHAADSSDANP